MSDPDPVAALTDDALVTRAAAGDDQAFGALVSRHEAHVFRLARALTRDREAAEDVLQQTFLSAWQALGRFRGDSSVRTWLLTIARHAAFHRRTEAARRPVDDTPIDELGIRAGWGGPGPEELAIREETRVQVARALDRLDPDHRAVLILRELEGLPGDETAALLGLTVAAMKSRLHRARLRFAAEWSAARAGGEKHATRGA